MDWRQSYSSYWRIYRVNRDTWADGEQVANVDSITLTRTADGSLLESGSMEVTGDIETDYYRIVMIADQGGEVVRVDVATLLFDMTKAERDYGVSISDADGRSVLYPASVTTILSGEYAPAGVNGAEYVQQMLAGVINAPVITDGAFYLNDHVVHEIGSSVLEAAWSVLEAGDFIMQIDGRGIVHIMEKPTEPSLIIDNSNTRLMQNRIQVSSDIGDIPNRYVVLDDNMKTLAVNDDPNSIVSTVSRGYYVDDVDESPTPVNGETLSAYALRKLRQASVMKEEYTYTREFVPDVLPYDIVKASIREMDGDLRISSQTITCDNGISINEKVAKEVVLW